MSNSPVFRVDARHHEGLRWLRLILAVEDDVEARRFLVYSAHFTCQIEGLDALASTYTLENWESGVMSGAFFAFRRAGKVPTHLVVTELTGRLRSEDMEVLAHASTFAVTKSLGSDVADLAIPGWQCQYDVGSSRPKDQSLVVEGVDAKFLLESALSALLESGISDPDVRLVLAQLRDDPEAVTAALQAGAEPTVTGRELLRKYGATLLQPPVSERLAFAVAQRTSESVALAIVRRLASLQGEAA